MSCSMNCLVAEKTAWTGLLFTNIRLCYRMSYNDGTRRCGPSVSRSSGMAAHLPPEPTPRAPGPDRP